MIFWSAQSIPQHQTDFYSLFGLSSRQIEDANRLIAQKHVHTLTHTHIFFFISIELIAVFYWLYCIRKKQIWMEQLQYRMEFDKMTRMHFYFVLKTYCDIVPVLLTHFTRINY